MTNHIPDLELLASRGWIEIPNYFQVDYAKYLLDYAKGLAAFDKMKPAGISTSGTVVSQTRRDNIFWVENWDSAETKLCGQMIQELGLLLKNGLRVSLKSFEGHFSHYSDGDFYKKHLDQHFRQRHRRVSFVSYLNSTVGGELVIYKKGSRNEVDAVISPEPGKLVLFVSEFIFHEVKVCSADRFGLTGWYRDDEDLYGDRLSL